MKKEIDNRKNTNERTNKDYISNGEEGQGCRITKKDTSEK
jgi:hypothetical protein